MPVPAPAADSAAMEVSPEMQPAATATEERESGSRNRNRRGNQQRTKNSGSKKNTAAATASQEEKPAEIMPVPVSAELEVKDTASEESFIMPQPEETPSESVAVIEKVSEETASQETVSLKPTTLPEVYRKKVRTALRGKGIPSAHYASIYKALINSYDKLALNNLLVKTFGSNKGGVVYNLIKDIFTDYIANR